jgi:hypothetical protein
MDENVKYTRSTYLNTRRPNNKSGLGYKNGEKHNSRVNTIGKEFIKFTKSNTQQEKQNLNNTNHSSHAYDTYAYNFQVSHMSYHDFDESYVLMRNKFGRVGPHHKRSKSCVWVPKCLITNLKGPNQTWVPKKQA